MRAPFLIALALEWLALSPQARAVCQEGCDTSNFNAFLGDDALLNNTTGTANTAIGFNALYSDTTGSDNTATGLGTLYANTTGYGNTATGFDALASNTTASYNTATGYFALVSNTTGYDNTATGYNTLYSNATGYNNTATGVAALYGNTTGYNNTANGTGALKLNTTGNSNTASGNNSLSNNTTGGSNIALGDSAGINLTTGKNNIYIGNAGSSSGESAKIRIGTTGTQRATFIAGISGVTVPAGVGVIVGTDGKLGTVVSSERFKDAIQPMDKASEAILALHPVTFRYKHELDPKGILQFGLVAEEVEKVNPDLVARDADGRPYTVRYEAVNAMLLNEFLKEHQKIEQQRKDFEAALAKQQKQIEALNVSLEKMSAQIELSKPLPRAAMNDR
jgi:hypothetical protein